MKPFALHGARSRRLATVLCAAALATTANAFNYSELPDFGATAETCAKYSVSLGRAIDIAEKACGGRATEAALDQQSAKPYYAVRLYATNGAWNMQVDASTGEIMAKQEVPRIPGTPVTGKPTVTDTGLQYYDIVVGTGAAPAGPASKVTLHYTGYLTDGSKFDSSVDNGQPITFPLNQFIKGWVEGVGSMKAGGKRKLLVPYQLAYGPAGNPPVIPPKALLIFDVELLDVPQP